MDEGQDTWKENVSSSLRCPQNIQWNFLRRRRRRRLKRRSGKDSLIVGLVKRVSGRRGMELEFRCLVVVGRRQIEKSSPANKGWKVCQKVLRRGTIKVENSILIAFSLFIFPVQRLMMDNFFPALQREKKEERRRRV